MMILLVLFGHIAHGCSNDENWKACYESAPPNSECCWSETQGRCATAYKLGGCKVHGGDFKKEWKWNMKSMTPSLVKMQERAGKEAQTKVDKLDKRITATLNALKSETENNFKAADEMKKNLRAIEKTEKEIVGNMANNDKAIAKQGQETAKLIETVNSNQKEMQATKDNVAALEKKVGDKLESKSKELDEKMKESDAANKKEFESTQKVTYRSRC